MSLKICVLGSGSSGNCTFVASPTTAVLVDVGLSALRIEKGLRTLSCDPDRVSVLITHAHHDHVSGLATFYKRHPQVKVYCHESCYPSLMEKILPTMQVNAVSGDFYIGDITVAPFRVSHDIPCVGYGLLSGGSKITVATDVGKISSEVLQNMTDSDLVVLESNHDEALVRRNPRYSDALKARILSNGGHLSNSACADCVAKMAECGVKQVVLAHLSRENNYPELAFETCKQRLLEGNLEEGKDIRLEVACHDKMSSLFEIN